MESETNRSNFIKVLPLKIILDFIILLIVGLPMVILKFGVYPFKRGFFCDDESIKHPNDPSVISDGVLIGVSLSVTIAGIMLAELIIYKRNCKRRLYHQTYSVAARGVHPYLSAIYKGVGMFLFTAAACQSTTDIMKYSLGRLRPHFLTVCKPDWSKFNCTDEFGRYIYVTEDVCTGDEGLIREARLSHPSGHASFSLCCFLFLTYYLQAKLKWKGSKLLRPLLQIVLIYMALYTGMSRISDYHHHWSDVLGGFVVGFIVSTICVFSLSELFKAPTLKDIHHLVNQLVAYSSQRNSAMERPLSNVSSSTNSQAILLNSSGTSTDRTHHKNGDVTHM